MTPLIACAIILGGFVLLDLMGACISGIGATASLWGHFSSRRRGTRLIDVPDDLQTAIANDLLGQGAELIVGYENEWEDDRIRRFAILPQQARAAEGEVFEVTEITRRKLELKPVHGPTDNA